MSTTTRSFLDNLVDPRSIVVVGASESEANRGGQAMSFLRKFGYQGTVTPVHPSGNTVHGYPGVKSLDDLDEVPDVALIAVGARNVSSVVADLGRIGVHGAIVWAGGFAEGGPEGAELQAELAVTAQAAGVRVIGPNCLGIVNSKIAFCGTFASWLASSDDLLAGHISMVTQSGGLGSAAHAAAQSAGIGFRYFVSTGNEVDIDAVEFLEVFADDPETHVICSYLEGVTDGRRVAAALDRARTNGKDVVVLKAGRFEAGARAAVADTGAMAGRARVWDAVLAEVGAIQVYSYEELLDVITSLESNWGKPALQGRRVGVLSYGGGVGVLATDQCAAAGLEVPEFSEDLQSRLRPLLPEIAATGNPIDMTPEAVNRAEYREHLSDIYRMLDDSDEIDTILLQAGASRGIEGVAQKMCEFHSVSKKPLIVFWRSIPAPIASIFSAHGIRTFASQQEAVRTLGRIVDARLDRKVAADGDPVRPRLEVEQLALPSVRDGQVLGEDVVHDILRNARVPTLRGNLARSKDDAETIAKDIGLPVAMKIVSEKITHRAAAGLVRLRVASFEAVRDLYDELVAAAQVMEADVVGVYVQEMGSPGTEFLISAMRDETFGPVVSCGAGGVYTEVLDDITFALAPLTAARARALIHRLRISSYLEKSGHGADIETLVPFLVEFSRLAAAIPWQRFVLEVNPAMATANRTIALDGLAVVEER